VNVSVIVLRRTKPDARRTVTVPGSVRGVPIVPILAIGTVLVMLTRLEPDAWLLGGIALASGAAAWALLGLTRALPTAAG